MKNLFLSIVVLFAASTALANPANMPSSTDFDNLQSGLEAALTTYAVEEVGMNPEKVVIGQKAMGLKKVWVAIDLEAQCSFSAKMRINLLKGKWVVKEIPGSNTCN